MIMVLENTGCPDCGSIVSFCIDDCEEVTAVKCLSQNVDLDRHDLGYATEYKPCPDCDGQVVVHYRSSLSVAESQKARNT